MGADDDNAVGADDNPVGDDDDNADGTDDNPVGADGNPRIGEFGVIGFPVDDGIVGTGGLLIGTSLGA